MADVRTKKTIIHVLYSGVGGHGNVLMNLIKADKNKEFVYKVLFFGIEPIRGAYIDFCNSQNIEYQYCRKREGVDLWFFIKIFLAIKKVNPEVVFLHGSYNILPAWFYKLISGSQILIRETQANNLKSKVDFFTLKIALKLSDEIVFLTDEFKSEICKKFDVNRNRNNLHVIPNGLNLAVFDSKRDYQKQPVVLSMVSRIVPIKDHTTLLRAMCMVNKKHPNIMLKIAGSGISVADLKIEIEELALDNVELVGELNEQQIVELLNESDLYVHPTFGETMSTSLMQAMSAGLPIVSSNVPGVVNMISNHKTGILVPTKEPEILAKSINDLIESKSTRKKYGEEAKKHAEQNFSADKMFEGYNHLIPAL